MSTRVTEITHSFRMEPGTVWGSLARIEGQGWVVETSDVASGWAVIRLTHPDLPGSYRMVEGEA